MTIEIPPGLQWVSYLAGSEWPKGDESAMFRLGSDWHDSASQLSDLIPDLAKVRAEVATVLAGDTAKAAQEQFAMLFDGDYAVDKLADAMSALGDLAKDTGSQIEYSKLQIISTLVISAAEILYALAQAPWTFGASLSWIPVIEAATWAAVRVAAAELRDRIISATTAVLSRTVVKELSAKAFKQTVVNIVKDEAVKQFAKQAFHEAVEETVTSTVQEFAIEGYQNGEGHHHGFNVKQIISGAYSSAVGGAAGAGAHHQISGVLGDATSVVGKISQGAFTHFEVGIVGNVAGSVAGGGGLDGVSVFGGAAGGAVSGGVHGSGGHGDSHPEPKDAESGAPVPDPPPPYAGPPGPTDASDSEQPPQEGADRQSDVGVNDEAPQRIDTAPPAGGGAAAEGQGGGVATGNGAAASASNGAAGGGATGGGSASVNNGAAGNGAAGNGASVSASSGAAGSGATGGGSASVTNGAAASVNNGAAGNGAAGNGASVSASSGAAGSGATGGGSASINNGAAASVNNGAAGNGAASVNNGVAGNGAASVNNGVAGNGAAGTGLAGNPIASVGKGAVGGGTDPGSAPTTSGPLSPTVAAGGVGGKGGLPSAPVPGSAATQVRSSTDGGAAALHDDGSRSTNPPKQPTDGAANGQRPSPSRPSAEVTSTTHGASSPATRKADSAASPSTTQRTTRRTPPSSRLHGLPSDGTDVPIPAPSVGSPSSVDTDGPHVQGRSGRAKHGLNHPERHGGRGANGDGHLPVAGDGHLADRDADTGGSSQERAPTSDVHSSEFRASRRLPTPPTDEPLVAPIPHSETTIRAVRNWIGDINHDGDLTAPLSDERLLNCGPATIAVFQRLSGTSDDARANLDVYTPDDLGMAVGLAVVPHSRDGIAQRLVDEGPGAHTTVVVHFAGGEQHAFNAFYDGTEIHAIDGQRGTVSSWPPKLDRIGNPVQAWFMGTPFHGDRGIFTVPDHTTEGRDGVPHRSVVAGAAQSGGLRPSSTDIPTEPDTHVADVDDGDGDGDGWVVDADGTQRWGRYGAAGLLLRAWNSDGVPVVLLQRRAEWTDEGGTWGLPGGARNRDETVEQAALRETIEETGLQGDRLGVRTHLVTARAPGIDWTYSTVIGDAPYPMRATSTEEGSHRWVAVDEVAELPLHPGLADSWEALRAQMTANPLTPPRPSPQLDHTIDPTDVSGVYAIGNPDGAVYYRDDNDLLYREDTRPPEVIFAEGFAVHPDHRQVNKFADFISTTRDPNLGYLNDKTTERVFRYTIDAPGGVDVNRTVGIGPSQYQQEISFPGGIRRENIRSAVEVFSEDEHQGGSDGKPESSEFKYGSVDENPYFKPDLPNDGAPRVLLGPLGGRQDADDHVSDHVSSILFRDSVSAGSNRNGGPDAWDVYMAGLEDSPGHIEPTSPERAIGPQYDSLHVPFDRGVKSVDGGLHAEVEDFVSKVVSAAERRYGARESGLVLHARGGGNGGIFSRGPEVVGRKRANAVLDAIRPQIERALQQRGMPPDFVQIPEPTSRGSALTDDLPGSPEQARRVVVVRIENQPQTDTPSAPHGPETWSMPLETSLPKQDSTPTPRNDLEGGRKERSDVGEAGTKSAGASGFARFVGSTPEHGDDRGQPMDSVSAVDISRSSLSVYVGLDSAAADPALAPTWSETTDDDDDMYESREEYRTRIAAAEPTDRMPEVGLDDSSGSLSGDHRARFPHAHQPEDSTPPGSSHRSEPAPHQRPESFLDPSLDSPTPTSTHESSIDDAAAMLHMDPELPGHSVHLSEVGQAHPYPNLAPYLVSPDMAAPNSPAVSEEGGESSRDTTPIIPSDADLDHEGGPPIGPKPPGPRLLRSARDTVEQHETASPAVSDGDRLGAGVFDHDAHNDSSDLVGDWGGTPDQPSDTHSLGAPETHDANTPPAVPDDTHSIVLFGDNARQLPVLSDGPERGGWNRMLEQAAEADGTGRGTQRQDAPRRLWERFNAARQASRAGSSQEGAPDPVRAELVRARSDLTRRGLDSDALTSDYRARFDPPEPPKPQLPARIGRNLVLGGSDVVEEFNSGDAAFKYFETVVREQAGNKAWEDNEGRIAAQFTDLGLRPKVAGVLRGGRPIAHAVDLGFGRTLTLDLQLIGASKHSKLDFENIEKDYEFEHTSDPTTVVGSLDDGRNTVLAGAQANLTIPNLNVTAGLFGTGAFERALREQRADRQISGAQTVESAHRFRGNIRAVLSHRKSESPENVTHEEVDFHTKLVVPSRDVTDRIEPNEADEARDTLGPLPSHSTGRPAPQPGDPPKVRYTHALSGSDVVTNLWLIPDDEAVTADHGAPPVDGTPPESRNSSGSTRPQRAADAGPPLQTVTEFLDSGPMKTGLRKAYGVEGAEQAKTEMSQWLTVELVQANLHGMTNKQPLILEFDHIDGAWVEVHAVVEPLGTPNHHSPANPSDESPAAHGDRAVGQPDRMLRTTGKTGKTEFHFGAETDTTEVRQNVVTWSGQLPTVRIRGQGDVGQEVGLSGGVDGTWTEGGTREETHSRQFRQRNTLKLAVPGQGLHGQVRLRFEMHSSDAVSPKGLDAPFKGAVVETRGRFDVLMEQSETEPAESLEGKTVWAPPQRIWGTGPSDERNSVAKSPWWRPLGTGGRTTVSTGGAAYWPSPPKVNRGAGQMAEPRGLGSMDRVTNLDLSGFRGMLDSMGHRAFGGDWADVRAGAAASHHLNQIRASLPGMSQKSPLIHSELSGPGSSTKTAFTADFEQLTFRRVISTLASPSAEVTEGSAITTTHNRQRSAQGAFGSRGGDVAGSPVAGELIAGVTKTVRDGDRGRNQERVAVATKFDQKMAVFDGWVRLDGTMVGSKATVHESGLFPVEIAIPLTELQASRLHDSPLPPTFTKARPNGFVDHPRPKRSPDPVPNPLPAKVPDALRSFGRNGVRPTLGTQRSFRDILKFFAVAPSPVPPPGVGNPSVYLTDVRDGTVPPRAPEPPPTGLVWEELSPVKNPPKPPAHTLQSAWHPSDMLLGVDPSVALVEAIREDLGPALGSGLDDAMAGVTDQFGPNVLTARLTHESGQHWSHDVPVPGGRITIKVRPVREPTHEYIGPSEKFETDLSQESQSAVSHIHDDVVRTVAGARLQIPFPHGSLAVQATRTASLPHRRVVVAAADQGASQLTDASGLNITGESDHRTPLRVRTTQPHNLFRHPIRFEISYEKHLGANLLSGIPDTPEPVRVSGVFSYPQHTPTPVGTGITRALDVDQVVLEVRPHPTPDQPAPAAGQGRRDDRPTAGEDLVARHVLDSITADGRLMFGNAWPKVRAELAPHVRTMVIQRSLGSHSRGGSRTVHLKSVRGGKVVLGGHVDIVHEADSKATSEFYSGGQHQLTAGVSSTKASNYALVIQAQGDVLPTGPTANVSVLGRIDGGYGNEALNTRTESSATSLLFRKKVESQTHIGTATIEAEMSRPTNLPGFTNNLIERTATAQVDFLTRQSPKDVQDHPNYVPRAGIIQPAEPGPGATQPSGLSKGAIVRAITDGDNLRAQTQTNVRAKLVWWKNTRIQSQLLRDLSDTRLVRNLAAMTRGEVELLRHGSLRITGHADVQTLDFKSIEHKGGNINVLNEVNQTRVHQDTRAYDIGFRALFGIRGSLPHVRGSVLGGGGANHRGRLGVSYAQGAKVTANVKYEDSFAVFHGSTRITLTVHDGTTQHELPGVDVHGPIMLPLADVTPTDAPVRSTPALESVPGLPEISTAGPSLADDRSEPLPLEGAGVQRRAADVSASPSVVPMPSVDTGRATSLGAGPEKVVIIPNEVSALPFRLEPPMFGKFESNPDFRPNQDNPNIPIVRPSVGPEGGLVTPLVASANVSTDSVSSFVAQSDFGAPEFGPTRGDLHSPPPLESETDFVPSAESLPPLGTHEASPSTSHIPNELAPSVVESDSHSTFTGDRDLDVPDGGAPAGSSSRAALGDSRIGGGPVGPLSRSGPSPEFGRADGGGHPVSRADQVRQMFGRVAPDLPMSDSALEDLLAGVPPELSVDPSLAECGPLANWLIHALHPGGVQGLAASDDSVLDLGGVSGAQARIMPGPGWNRIRDLSDLRAVVEATPGTTAVIMASYGDNDRGHVFALHSAATGGVRVLDPQRMAGDRVSEFGETPSEQTDLSTSTTAWAVVVDVAGGVVEPGRWSEHIGVAEAILDAPLSHDFGSSRRSQRGQSDLDEVLDNLENLRRQGSFTPNERFLLTLSLDDLPSIADDQRRRVTALGVDLPDHLQLAVEHVDSSAGQTAPRPASRRVQHSNAEAGPSRPRLSRTEAGPSTATGASSAAPRRTSGTAGLPVARSMGGGERPPTERSTPEASNVGPLGFPEPSDDQTGDGASKGKAKEKARKTKRARDEHDDDGEQTAEPSRPIKRPKTESSASGKSNAAGRSEAAGPSTPVAPEAGKHRMTAEQVDAMLGRLAEEIATRGEGRWVSKIAKEFPGQLDPNRKWLTESGWTQKNLAQTLSRMPDYPDHRASIQDLVNRLGLHGVPLPEPQGEYHIRFTAENLLAALRAFRGHRNLSASEQKRSAFKYVASKTGIPEQTLKRFLYQDGGLAMSGSQLSRSLPGYNEQHAQLQEALRRLGHDDIADDLPEPGAHHVEEMTAEVVAGTLNRLAENPDRSMVDIGRELGFDRQALLRYVGPRNEGLRPHRTNDLAGLPNYAEHRDSIAAALRRMGQHDQARALAGPGRTDETAGEAKPKRRAPRASLAARAPARAPAGLPIARVGSDPTDVKMSDVDEGRKASKGKARAVPSRELDSGADHDDVASRVKREPDLSDSVAENSGALEGDRHMTTARQVEAMLRRLEAETRKLAENRRTLVEIGREFPGTEGGNARWLSASTWATAQLDVVLSRMVDYEQHREAIQRLVTRMGIYIGTLPDPERHYHHPLTAAELVEALRSRAGFQSAPQAERRGGAHVYMRRKAGLGDSSVLEKWIYADGKLKAALGQLNSLPGYAANRDHLSDAFRRLGHDETAENLPEPSARKVEELTADVVAAALEMLVKNPNLSMTVIGRELGVRSEALLRYIGPRNDGLREPSSLVTLSNFDAQQRDSIAAALNAMGRPDQSRNLPMPQVMHAANFLTEMRVHRRQVGDAIEQMRQDPALLPRDAALAAGVPAESFALAVDSGPTIRQQSNVEAQLSRVEPELRRGLDQTFERLGALARGEQVDDAIPMTAVPLAKNPIAPTRLFVVENPDLEGKAYEAKLKRLYDANPAQVRNPRSYADDRARQLLRWMSTVLREQLARSGEVQSYYDTGQKAIFVSSNTGTGNKQIRTLLDAEGPGLDSLLQRRESERRISRETRHWTKLKNALSNPHPHADRRVDEILEAIRNNRFHVPDANYQSNGETVDVHAERRIKYAVESLNLSPMDLSLLAGTLRACGHCAAALDFPDDQTRGPFWQSKGAGYRLDGDRIMRENMGRSVGTNVTRTRDDVITADYNTDSEASSDEDAPPAGKRRGSGAKTQNPKGKGANVKGKDVDRSGAVASGDADLDEEQQALRDDIDPEQVDSMLNRWDALPPGQEFEPDSDETQVIEQIRRGARLPGDLAERFERLGVRGPRPHPEDPEWLTSDDPFDDDVEMADASSGEDMDLDTGSDAGSADESEQNRSHIPTKAPPAAMAGGRGVDGAAIHERLRSDAGDQQPIRRRDNDFGGRRTQASPTATFSERFEASTDGPDGRGFLKGLTTQISYDQRRFQLPDQSWVRDFEIRLELKPGSGIGPDDVTLLQQRLSEVVDRDLNDRYELPGGDKLNVTVLFDAPKPHGTVTVHGAADTNQQNFSVHAPSGVLTHEILHYLGLPEGYRDPKALLARSLDRDGPMGERAAHGGGSLSVDQLAKIDEIAHHGPVHDLAHGATPMPIQPREVLHHEPVAAHEPTPAPHVPPGSLDERFGDAVQPKNVKKSEKDDQGQVRLNPLWYRLEDFKPALLERGGVWLYAIDEEGGIFIGSEGVWSLADASEREALLAGMRERDPALTMEKLKAAVDDQGVPTVAAGFEEGGATRIARARVGGELFKDPATGRWTIDASSRYTGPVVRPGVEPARVTRWVANAAEQIGAVLGFVVDAQDAEHPRIAHGAFVAGTAGPGADEEFGPLAGPKKVKDREFDDAGQVRLNPLWYRLQDFKPALLERTDAVWHYTVDEDGQILLGSDQLLTIAEEGELQNLLKAMQDKDPGLTMDRLKGFIDNQGHPTVAAGFDPAGVTRLRPARISGELSFKDGSWQVTDKSGRYMSNKVRPGLKSEDAQRWLTRVAHDMSATLGVDVAAVLFKNATTAHPAPPPATDDVAVNLGRAEPGFGSPQYLPPFDEGAKSLNEAQTVQVSRIAAEVVEQAASRHAQGRGGLVLHADGGGNDGVFSKGPEAVGLMRADAVLDALKQEIKRHLQSRQIPEEMVTFSAPTSRGTRLTNGIPQWGKQARRVVVVHVEDPASS